MADRSEPGAGGRPRPARSVDPRADLDELRRRYPGMTPPERAAGWWDGTLPILPVMALFGIRPRRADTEGAYGELTLGPDLLDASGATPPGLLTVLADVVTGNCVSASLTESHTMATVTITIEQIVDELPTSGVLVAHARAGRARGDLTFAGGDIRHAASGGTRGPVVARIGAWYVHLPLAKSTGPLPVDVTDPPVLPRPDARLGPIGERLGLRIDRGDMSAVGTLPIRLELLNSGLVLHGGAGALAADLVCEAALGGGGVFRPLTTTCSYLRAAGAGGGEVAIRARVLKPGRVVATVEAEVVGADGKPALHIVTNVARGPSGSEVAPKPATVG